MSTRWSENVPRASRQSYVEHVDDEGESDESVPICHVDIIPDRRLIRGCSQVLPQHIARRWLRLNPYHEAGTVRPLTDRHRAVSLMRRIRRDSDSHASRRRLQSTTAPSTAAILTRHCVSSHIRAVPCLRNGSMNCALGFVRCR